MATTRPDARTALDAALSERVVILDGAMGTQIQGFGLEEADFRGAWGATTTSCSSPAPM